MRKANDNVIVEGNYKIYQENEETFRVVATVSNLRGLIGSHSCTVAMIYSRELLDKFFPGIPINQDDMQ